MNQTRNRQPLILVTAVVVAFALAFLAGQLLGGSSEPKNASQPGKAAEVDVAAPAIGSAGASQSLPDLKQTKPPKQDSTAATNGNQSQGNTTTQQDNTQQQQSNNTAPQNNTQQQQNNTQQNTNTQTETKPDKQQGPIIEEGSEEGGGTE